MAIKQGRLKNVERYYFDYYHKSQVEGFKGLH